MKSYHIAAYSFQADIWCCNCIEDWAADQLFMHGFTLGDIDSMAKAESIPTPEVGMFAERSYNLLSFAAPCMKVWDWTNMYSYDSDYFPKVIFVDQIEDKEHCGNCLGVIF